jgi:hypothetical protein
MILHAQINKDGTLSTKLPKSLWGKKVIISVRQEVIESKELKEKNFDGLLEEGYKTAIFEDIEIANEFEFIDSEGWDEY